MATSEVKFYVCEFNSDCGKVVRRLDRHLRGIHGLRAKDEQYIQLLKNTHSTPEETVDAGLRARHRRPTHVPLYKLQLENALNSTYDTCQLNVPATVERFSQWLQSFEGGERSDKSATQYVHQVCEFTETFENNAFCTKPANHGGCEHSLLNGSFVGRWVETVRHTRRPETVRAQLCALRLYVTFLQGHTQTYTFLHPADLQEVITRIDSLSKLLSKRVLQRRQERRQQETDAVLAQGDVAAFMTASWTQHILKKLGRAETHTRLPPLTCLSITQVLVTLVILENATRPQPLASMTAAEVEKAQGKAVAGENIRVVAKRYHKTYNKHGAAHITFSPSLYDLLAIYARVIRPQLLGERETPFLFVNSKGSPFTPSSLSHAAKQAMGKAGIRKNFNCTIYRKAAATLAARKFPDWRGNFADHMTHSEKTQALSYIRNNTAQNSAEVSSLLRREMNAVIPFHNSSPPVSQPMPRTVAASPVSGAMDISRKTSAPSPTNRHETEWERLLKANIGSPKPSVQTDAPSCDDSEPDQPRERPPPWPASHVATLAAVFEDFIVDRKAPTETLRIRLAADPRLDEIRASYPLSKIRDRLRCFWR